MGIPYILLKFPQFQLTKNGVAESNGGTRRLRSRDIRPLSPWAHVGNVPGSIPPFCAFFWGFILEKLLGGGGMFVMRTHTIWGGEGYVYSLLEAVYVWLGGRNEGLGC